MRQAHKSRCPAPVMKCVWQRNAGVETAPPHLADAAPRVLTRNILDRLLKGFEQRFENVEASEVKGDEGRLRTYCEPPVIACPHSVTAGHTAVCL
eukprot:6452949-Prymnesium_polylepis.3